MIREVRLTRRVALACAVAVLAAAAPAAAQAPVAKPQPTVPEVFTLMGQYVRVAYNNEGYVTLGYRPAQQSVGEEWLMLTVGLTVRDNRKTYTLKREHLSIRTPDGTRIPLATQKEYMQADLRALNMRTKMIRDSINYFPIDVRRGAPMRFFADLDGANKLSYDEVELSNDRGVTGRLFFKVPGGIKVGQHWLDVKFESSEVQVPFRILTEAEAKEFEKSWEDIKDEHEESMKKQ